MPKKKKQDTQIAKRPVGKPPLIKSPEEMELKIVDYFTNCPDKRVEVVFDTEGNSHEILIDCPTLSGMTEFLGFVDRHSMYDYIRKPEYTHTIKKAYTAITRHYEKIGASGKAQAFIIFMLKNLGFSDRQEIIHQDVTPRDESIYEKMSVEDILIIKSIKDKYK